VSPDPRVLVLDELRKQTALLERILAALSPSAAANDRVCDGPHGDPIIKAKSPRDWNGDDMTGRKFSECPPEYLDMVADRFQYFADDASKQDKRTFNLRDAARARGWAARIRAGYVAPQPQASEGEPRW